jgi:hypothetical protein
LPDPVLAALHERTEGWAAGLRLAALALAGHPDPVRFATEFSGTERTVAEYLLAEVLDRHSGQGRRLLLLRTSMLERVNGELASLLTGDDGAEMVLQDLEQAGAFVVSLDAARPSVTPRPGETGRSPRGCSPTPGPAFTLTGRTPPSTISSPRSPPVWPTPTPSWRWWPRPMSWRKDRWRRRSGIWTWPSGHRPR